MSIDSGLLQASVSVPVDLPLGEAWSLLQDFSLAHNYVPRLTSTEIVSEQRSGPGAHRRVYTGRRYLEETIIGWNEGRGFVLKLHKGSRPMPPFRLAEFEYALSASGTNQTRIQLDLRFIMPLGGLGLILGQRGVLPAVRKQLVQVAAGMKHFYETGEPATDRDRKRLAEAVEVAPTSD